MSVCGTRKYTVIERSLTLRQYFLDNNGICLGKYNQKGLDCGKVSGLLAADTLVVIGSHFVAMVTTQLLIDNNR